MLGFRLLCLAASQASSPLHSGAPFRTYALNLSLRFPPLPHACLVLVSECPPSRPCVNRTTVSRSTSLVLVSFCELLGSGLLATQILSSAQVEVKIALQADVRFFFLDPCPLSGSFLHQHGSIVYLSRKPLSLSGQKHPRTSSHGTHNFIQMPYGLLSTALGKVAILSGSKSRIAEALPEHPRQAKPQGARLRRPSPVPKRALSAAVLA